jgi:DNA-directed RNA polymerase subunit K/omega
MSDANANIVPGYRHQSWLQKHLDTGASVNIMLADVQPRTRFETARAMGVRAEQIAQGDPCRAVCMSTDPVDKAAEEFRAGAFQALTFRRICPGGVIVSKPFASVQPVTGRTRTW